ncbi:unnamed protein product [Gongylonema pulchrum]|uniref:DUF309 domain-containing protein n=1 Tax=Gongylonema pulchrum TaxID=637853 RepID=A0A183DGF3_9BILA|nr:unnamed protein product [Gongylonema pulchrum]
MSIVTAPFQVRESERRSLSVIAQLASEIRFWEELWNQGDGDWEVPSFGMLIHLAMINWHVSGLIVVRRGEDANRIRPYRRIITLLPTMCCCSS